MKKSLIALAVLSAVAGAAQAQSSVTVYGLVDMGLQRQDIGATKTSASATTTALDSGNQSGSRLGFKGSEDLGGGLKANFKLEMGINADEGKSAQGGRTFGRQAYVGLAGDFGAVNFGRQYTPVFVAIDSFDPFSTGMSSGTAGSGTSTLGAGAYFDHGNVRMDNSVTFSTNDVGGFTANLAYGMGEVAGDNKAKRYMGLSAAYTGGPLFVEAAYSNRQDTVLTATTLDNAVKSTLIAGTYDFSVVKLHGAYQSIKDDGVAATALKRDVWSFGVTVPVSAAGSVVANYIDSRNKNSFLTDMNAKQYAIGYTHSLSKRTNLYTSYSQAKNDANINLGSADSGPTFHPVANGATVKLFNVGIRHMF
ncbi:porin [Undibacterium sp.]|uniref:porin n=1 Tax=Undibacterium sp. TaxID=1914977 RepID=UPI0025FE404A|nr:porin [Undibacterium sp.]